MQVVINIKPENEEKFIKALDATNIPYWIEENKPVVTEKEEAIADALEFMSNELGEEANLRQLIDEWCYSKYGNDGLETADKMFTELQKIIYPPQPAVTQDVSSDEEAADEYFGWKNPATISILREKHAAVYNAFINGRQSLRQQYSKQQQ